LLRVTPQRAAPLELHPGVNQLPTGGTVEWTSGRAELSAGLVSATLNDVVVQGTATVRVGDIIVQNESTYLALPRDRAPSSQPSILGHAVWALRVEEEVAAARDSISVLVGRSAAFEGERFAAFFDAPPVVHGSRLVVGRSGRALAEFLLIGAESEREDIIRQSYASLAQAQGETVRWGLARFPRDGGTGEELLE